MIYPAYIIIRANKIDFVGKEARFAISLADALINDGRVRREHIKCTRPIWNIS